jgi:hypothetical protein
MVSTIIDGLDQVYEALVDIKSQGNVIGFQPKTPGCNFLTRYGCFVCMDAYLISTPFTMSDEGAIV